MAGLVAMRLASLSRQNMALDLVAVPIGSLVMRIRFAAIDFVGNDRRGSAPGQPVAGRGTIVSPVGQQFLWRGQGLQQRHGGGLCPGPGLGPLFTPRRTVDLNGGAIDSVLVMCADNLA